MVMKSQAWQFFDEKRERRCDCMKDERRMLDAKIRAIRMLGGYASENDETVRKARAFLGV